EGSAHRSAKPVQPPGAPHHPPELAQSRYAVGRRCRERLSSPLGRLLSIRQGASLGGRRRGRWPQVWTGVSWNTLPYRTAAFRSPALSALRTWSSRSASASVRYGDHASSVNSSVTSTSATYPPS